MVVIELREKPVARLIKPSILLDWRDPGYLFEGDP
jgi:hypothetical protein